MKLKILLTFGSLLALSLSPAPAAPSSWSIADRIHLGGEGGWDYLVSESATSRLFVSHGTQVLVVDTVQKSVIGSIPGKGLHGIALAPDLKKGFTSNGGDNTVSVFDLDTLKVTKSIEVMKNPDAICYEPVTRRVFAFNGGSGTASVIDSSEEKVVGEIALDGKPEFAVADGQGSIFNALEDKDEIIKINATSLKIEARWTMPKESEPAGIAIDLINQRLFAGCGNQTLLVLDCGSGKVIATLPIGKGIDACVYDPTGKRVFVSCGDGTMTVVQQTDKDNYTVSATVNTEPRSRTMTFDSKTGTAYLPTAKFGPAPAPSESQPRPRPPLLPDSFELLVVKQKN